MFLPEPTKHGGSRVGNSYISLYANCPRKWFYTFIYPIEVEPGKWSKGIAPRHTAPALLGGSIFHEMMAAYYLSGVKNGEDTGEYDLDRAIQAGEAHYAARKQEYLDLSVGEDAVLTSTEMITGYYQAYGPDSPAPDYPTIKVVTNEQGEPYIEKEFTIGLGYKDYIYTTRLDLIIGHHSFLKSMEHKTSVASWANRTLAGIHRKSQFTGEIFVMVNAFPDHVLNGCMVNVCVKNRSTKSTLPVALRDTTGRTPDQLERFRLRVIKILQDIDSSVNAFSDFMLGGMAIELAADQTFPEYGEYNEHCNAFNRECEYMPFCKGIQAPDISLRSFRPRSIEENSELKEYSG